MAHTIAQIASALDATFTGDGDWSVERPMPPAYATNPHDLALAMNEESLRALGKAECRAVIVGPQTGGVDLSPFDHVLTVSDTRTTLARLTALFAIEPETPGGIHPSAFVDATAEIGDDVSIGPFSYIGARSIVGSGTRILSNVTIGADVTIGPKSLLYPGVRIGDRITLGARVIMQNNVSVGADGFGYAAAGADAVETAKETGEATGSQGMLLKIGSLGTVEIGDDVEIGANSCIDRATFTVTRIGAGTKIDNLVQIGHNVTIGRDCRICGAAAIAGSATIGDRAVLGGGAGVADRMRVGEDSLIMASSSVATKVPPRSIYGGIPAIPRNRLVEQIMQIGRLRFLFEDVKRLKERVEKIETDGKNT